MPEEHNIYYITKINPDSIKNPINKLDWFLLDCHFCVIDYAYNMDELLIRADLMGINKNNISLLTNQFTGDITEYTSEDYFNCKDRIQWVNQ